MKQLRTFIALELSPAVRKHTLQLQKRLQPLIDDVRWSRQDGIHLTLKFLGEVPEIELPAVCQAVRAAAEKHPPLQLQPTVLGAFPHLGRPRVFWLGVGGEHEPLLALQQDVDRCLNQAGFPIEHRRFHAHLTLGRCRRARDLEDGHFQSAVDWLAESAGDPRLQFQVNEVATFASFLEPGGARYQAIGHATFGIG
jgi:2'-5' RNA ligase